MTNLIRAGLLCVALSLVGCQSFYTSIERGENDSYILTRVHQGFWTVSSSVERCEALGDRFKCETISD